MDIVITHEGTDFDGLASMIAVKKLYPIAVPVFPGSLSNQVKDFMALFKDQFRVLRPKDINFDEVKRIIMVDTKNPARVGPFRDLLFDEEISKIVYDHHILDEYSFNFKFVDFTSPVGATTTILVKRIQLEEIPITPTEATLFALGIYHDTGCLIYNTTTPLDAEMVAFLLRNGANLSVIEEFVEFSLNEAQQEVLNVLLDQIEHETIHGLRVDIYSAVLDEYLLGVNNIIHKLRDIREADLYFVIVEMVGRVLVVARSEVETVHLGQFLEPLGGGGHAGAASTMIKKAKLEDIKAKIIEMLHNRIQIPRMARDIMTTPVKTVQPNATIQQAEEIMLRFGHSGLIVSDETGIKGIFSRRDLDKLKKHDMNDAPVKGYMTRKVVSISSQTPVSEIQRLMVGHDIGRLPVVDDNGELIGIITRTDLLKTLYGEEITERQSHYGSSLVEVEPKQYNIIQRLEQTSWEYFDLFCKIRDLSKKMNITSFLVGGFVRDILLYHSSQDLDIVVEGDGIEFAKELQRLLGGKLDTHPEFGTATLEFENYHLDIVTARVEYYEYPAALPQVEPSLLKQDLYRRDFTINSLAISLGQERFGWLVDFFGGKDDLELGIIRGLHSFTFIDDPTRILRGIKFAVRFDFKIEEETDMLIHQAVQYGVFKELKGPRFFDELKNLLMEEKEINVFKYLEEYGILKEISSQLELNEDQWKQLRFLEVKIKLFVNEICYDKDQVNLQRWLLSLMVIFAHLNEEEKERIGAYWNFSQVQLSRLRFSGERAKNLNETLQRPELSPSEIYDLLQPLHYEELVYLLLINDSSLILERVLDYSQRLKRIEIEISGKDIICLGFFPGPCFKEVISKVKAAKLDGLLKDRQEELEFVKAYFKEKEGGVK
ncbi:MAG: CBS domain-containing protein [Halanaerobiales bacterium]|nr:CBS domain-containing protein [Halanaerobiales bacterium]